MKVNIEQLSKEELIDLIRKSEAEMAALENKLAALERARSFVSLTKKTILVNR